jgi:glycosyltransferase involved in cell wall biosynthesis
MTSSRPRVSVIIPTHNRSGFLRRTLASVLRQKDVDLQIIVVDDGSTDDTPEMLAAIDDPRVTVLRNDTPQKVSAARNRGIAVADGEWVAFLDDDDLWAPDKLSSQIRRSGELGRTWSFGGTIVVDPELNILGGGPPLEAEEVARDLAVRNTVTGGASNVVIRRDILQQVGNFDTSLRHMSDWDLWIRIGRTGPPAVVPDPLLGYVLHPGNASSDTPEIPGELAVFDARYEQYRDGRPVDRAYVFRWIGWNSLRAGRRTDALRAYGRAMLAGDLSSGVRAVAGLLAPSVFHFWLRFRRDADYEARAERWLRDLRGELP